MGVYGPVPDATLGLLSGLANGTLDATAITGILAGDLPDDAPVNFTGTGAFGKVGATSTLAVAEPGSGVASVATSLLLPGLGTPINNYMRVHDAASGAPLPGLPRAGPGARLPRGTGDRRRHRRRPARRDPGRRQLGAPRVHHRRRPGERLPEVHRRLDRVRPIRRRLRGRRPQRHRRDHARGLPDVLEDGRQGERQPGVVELTPR